jgi:PKD repeat protein
MRYLLLSIFFTCTIQHILAQCIPTNTSTFGLPASVCPDETINFNNPHTGSGFTYEWDFCTEDMLTSPQITELTNFFGINPTEGRLVFENGEYFLFYLGYVGNKLIRIDLGNSPTNSPQAIRDLGNISGILSNPWTLQIIKDESTNTWFGITINYLTNQFVRLTFGSSVKNTPTASFMGTLAPSYTFISTINLKKIAANYYLFVVGYFTNSLAILNLGTSLTSNFNSSNIINEVALPSLSEPNDMELLEDCGEWNLILTSTTGNRHLRFTSGLNNPPTISTYPYQVGFGTPTGLFVVNENGKYYALSIDVTGKAQISTFGNTLNNTPTHTFLGTITPNPNFANFYGIDGTFWQSKLIIFGTNYSNNRLFRINFERNCGANQSVSTDTNPANISYRNAGIHPVVLSVKNSSGEVVQRYEGNANINPSTTVGNFVAQNVCLGNAITFNNTSVGADSQVASWLWQFGDSNTSNLKNPTHTYSAAGTYNVSLTVNNLNGCSNTIIKQVVVSAGVQANFQEVPTACVGQSISFQNLSTFSNLPFDEAEGFYWNFGDGTFSPFRNPTKIYNTAGSFTITLTVKDQAGCTDVISKNITILENPAIFFNVPTNICAGQPVQFTSVTSNATEFLWFFEGNGTSTQANPIVTFAQGGFYDVTLQVRNNNNCVATFTIENIQVLSAPNIIFNTQRVAGNPLSIHFENFTAGASQVVWDLGDGNTSNLFNPTHTYSQSGEYLVKLTATSENGCQSTFEQIVSVGTLRADIAVSQVRFENGRLFVTIVNKGNTILNDTRLSVQIADTTFSEVYSPIILPNEAKEIRLNLTIPDEILARANYLCVKALPKPLVIDSNLGDNESCLNIKNSFVVFAPYPNPAQKEITLSFTAPNEGILKLHIQDMLGKVVSQSLVFSKGFNQETLNVENLAKGIYIFTFEFDGKAIHRKIVIQ